MSRSASSFPADSVAPFLSTGGGVARLKASQAMRWRPGLGEASHSEVFASGDEASGAGLALALALDHLRQEDRGALAECDDQRPVLWVQDRKAIRLTGRPYRVGLPDVLRHRLIHVAAEEPRDALFALEEGLRCRDLACVIGEVAGNPRVLDFTASRRLSLTAERHGTPLWLIRLDAAHDLSSARMRWTVEAAPSLPPDWNADAPGLPRWRARLFRARRHAPGEWMMHDDGQALVASKPQQAGAGRAAPYPVGLAFAAGSRSLAL